MAKLALHVSIVGCVVAICASAEVPCESAAYAFCCPVGSRCGLADSVRPIQNITNNPPPLGEKPPWPSAHWPSTTYLWREMPSEAQSRCSTSQRGITCSHSSTQFNIAGQKRTVHYQRPASGAVKGTVIIFHGWNLYADYGWDAQKDDYYGLYNKVRTVQALLEAGYVVITPNAQKPAGYWDTNESPYNTANLVKWEDSPDDELVLALLSGIGEGRFGAGTSLEAVHAVGFSSGGYMTSRMAYNYEGRFKSLAIASASYYYCGGEYCPASIAASLKSIYKTHPPTLFMHGTKDSLVPVSTSETYYKNLKANNVATRRVTVKNMDHQWMPDAYKEVLAWIQQH